MSDGAKCCGAEAPLDQIRSLYTDLALQPDRDFGWGKGKDNARRLGYDPAWLERLPDPVWESAAAVGNPFSMGAIHPGETVVDLGCGAGTDLCIASLLVGAAGRVIGADVTPAMVDKARANAKLAGLSNIEVHQCDMARLPLPAACAHVVISNGSINLALDKAAVFNEAYRILCPGGRFQSADMVRSVGSCATAQAGAETSWADCVSGTLPAEELLSLLRKVGFRDVTLVGLTDYKTSPTTIGAMFHALK